MKVLVVCDRPGWAFDAIAQALAARAPSGLDLQIFYLKGHQAGLERAAARSDLVFAMHWSLVAETLPSRSDRVLRRTRPSTVVRLRDRFPFLDPAKTLVGVHAHHDWDERRTDPGYFVPPPAPLVEYLGRFCGVNTVSRRLTDLFRDAGLENVAYTPNGVDTDGFRPTAPLSDGGPLRVGYAGTKKRDWKEGISEFIEPLESVPWLDVRIAMPQQGRLVLHDQMPDFYNGLDVYVSASRSEGMSLAVLEAAACGRPVVSTRVGGTEEILEQGVNGLFVERSQESILDALEQLHRDRTLLRRLGDGARASAERSWSWDAQAPRWLEFVHSKVIKVSLR